MSFYSRTHTHIQHTGTHTIGDEEYQLKLPRIRQQYLK